MSHILGQIGSLEEENSIRISQYQKITIDQNMKMLHSILVPKQVKMQAQIAFNRHFRERLLVMRNSSED